MQRLLARGLVLSIALGLAVGCGKSTPPPPMTADQEKAAAAEVKQAREQEARALEEQKTVDPADQ